MGDHQDRAAFSAASHHHGGLGGTHGERSQALAARQSAVNVIRTVLTPVLVLGGVLVAGQSEDTVRGAPFRDQRLRLDLR
jgi:hypothetical protein